MSILRKRGKEKLRFKNMNKQRVSNKDFKYLKRLFLQCLKENSEIEKQLDFHYRRLEVFFFYEQTEPNIEKTIMEFLKVPDYSHHPESKPAFTTSEKGLGCIAFFLKHLRETTEKRNDIQDVEAYHKNGIFEELCHLVEQKGDSSIVPRSYWILWNHYRSTNRVAFGDEIVQRLDTDRNHYEVYLMIIEAYPKEWVERYWRYFMTVAPDAYGQRYQEWKKNVPRDVAYARLVTDTLRAINVLYVAEKVPKERLSNRQKRLLRILIETAKQDIEKKKSLIERDMGSGALTLIDSLDEDVFKTSEIFFLVILDLWKSLRLF